jgi:hypothetical protein
LFDWTLNSLQGGICKYAIRRQIFKQGFAFASALAVFIWCRGELSLCAAKVRGGGTSTGVFEILRRFFIYIAESSVTALEESSSPKFHTDGAVEVSEDGEKRRKGEVFCVEPDLNPPVAELKCQPVSVGLVPGENVRGRVVVEPYLNCTLNAMSARGIGRHSGSWRRLTCACDGCSSHHEELEPCSGRGRGVPGPAWRRFTIGRRPPPLSKGTFLSSFVDGLLTGSKADFDDVARAAVVFVSKVFHRRIKVGFVKSRFDLLNAE